MACDFLENFLIRHCKICMSSYEYVRILKVCVQNQEKNFLEGFGHLQWREGDATT